MAKNQTMYVCANCGDETNAWSGKCMACGQWNTLEEIVVEKSSSKRISGSSGAKSSLEFVELKKATNIKEKRLSTAMKDIDIVLGGGLVPGSVVLLAGEPGIGKSTLLMQVAAGLSSSKKVLYVSAEESTHQVALRAKRLSANSDSVSLSSSTVSEDIAAVVASNQFDAVIVDSIQTISTDRLISSSGSVSQITSSAHMIIQAAKQSDTAVIFVGHVTKEGNIAGPKILEHIVDVVLQLEGDRYGGFKVLRGVKNRFGATHEVAILEMTNGGLEVVTNPSAALLEERQVTDGSVVMATMEGTRPILVEVQALVNTTSYGYPKRTASGIDINRLNLLVAVLEKRTKLNLSDKDIYINIVGGLKVNEPAADLAICMAIGSASKGMKLDINAVVFGEVGLSGEVRHVPFIEKRVQEAKKMSFKKCIGPKNRSKSQSLSILDEVSDVRSALNSYLKS